MGVATTAIVRKWPMRAPAAEADGGRPGGRARGRAPTGDNPSAPAPRQRPRRPPPRAPAGGRNSSLPARRRSSAGSRRHTPPSARTRPAPPPRAPAGGSPSARLSHLLHERPERRPALLVVLEHVVEIGRASCRERV